MKKIIFFLFLNFVCGVAGNSWNKTALTSSEIKHIGIADSTNKKPDPVWAKHYYPVKSPMAAGVFGFIMPTGGQLYNEDYLKAVFFFAGYFPCIEFMKWTTRKNYLKLKESLIILPAYHLLTIVDAVYSADDKNAKFEKKKNAVSFHVAAMEGQLSFYFIFNI
jgi:hypothetical protein